MPHGCAAGSKKGRGLRSESGWDEVVPQALPQGCVKACMRAALFADCSFTYLGAYCW